MSVSSAPLGEGSQRRSQRISLEDATQQHLALEPRSCSNIHSHHQRIWVFISKTLPKLRITHVVSYPPMNFAAGHPFLRLYRVQHFVSGRCKALALPAREGFGLAPFFTPFHYLPHPRKQQGTSHLDSCFLATNQHICPKLQYPHSTDRRFLTIACSMVRRIDNDKMPSSAAA